MADEFVPEGLMKEINEDVMRSVRIPDGLYQELERLSLAHDRSIEELIGHAVAVHYSQRAVSARLRVLDRLARLEASMGDPEVLKEQLLRDSRIVRSRP